MPTAWIHSAKFKQDESEIVAPKPVSHRPRPQKLSGSLLPRFAVTKHFSHANWASAGERMKDGDVTERVNREGSAAPLLDGKVEVDVVV